MAYQTGTGANIVDLMDALRGFAEGLGWTVQRWNTTTRRLYLEKGPCKIALGWLTTTTVADWSTGVSVPTPDHIIQGVLCSALNPASDNFWTFPGIAPGITTATSQGIVATNGLTGPFVGWFFFSDAGGNYIHVVVQTAGDRYVHFHFGKVDQGSMTHSGAAYLHGLASVWYRDTNAPLPDNATLRMNNTQIQNPFGTTSPAHNYANSQLFVVDALPETFTNNQAVSSAASASQQRDQPVLGCYEVGRFGYPSTGNVFLVHSSLMGHIVGAEATGWSAMSPMFGIPKIVLNATRTLACAVGFVPDLRLINLTGLVPPQEITVGGEVWKVFPFMRQTPWAEAKQFFAPSSGQYGIALKKIL